MTDWHVDAESLRRYSTGTLGSVPLVWSVEAHLMRCAPCRERQREHVDAAPLERIWQQLDGRADEPRRGVIERLLLQLHVAPDAARLIAITPALSAAWISAVAVVLAFAALMALTTPSGQGSVTMLVLIPFLPLAGVAAAYGPRADPMYEIGLTTPFSGTRLLLLRATAVLTTTSILASVASVASPLIGGAVLAWLVPSLGLTLLSLALSTMVHPPGAAAISAASWAAAVLAARVLPAVAVADLFGASSQVAFAGLACAAAACFAARRRRLDTA